MKKKILSLVLALSMVLSFFPGMTMTASAEGEPTVEWILTKSDKIPDSYSGANSGTFTGENSMTQLWETVYYSNTIAEEVGYRSMDGSEPAYYLHVKLNGDSTGEFKYSYASFHPNLAGIVIDLGKNSLTFAGDIHRYNCGMTIKGNGGSVYVNSDLRFSNEYHPNPNAQLTVKFLGMASVVLQRDIQLLKQGENGNKFPNTTVVIEADKIHMDVGGASTAIQAHDVTFKSRNDASIAQMTQPYGCGIAAWSPSGNYPDAENPTVTFRNVVGTFKCEGSEVFSFNPDAKITVINTVFPVVVMRGMAMNGSDATQYSGTTDGNTTTIELLDGTISDDSSCRYFSIEEPKPESSPILDLKFVSISGNRYEVAMSDGTSITPSDRYTWYFRETSWTNENLAEKWEWAKENYSKPNELQNMQYNTLKADGPNRLVIDLPDYFEKAGVLILKYDKGAGMIVAGGCIPLPSGDTGGDTGGGSGGSGGNGAQDISSVVAVSSDGTATVNIAVPLRSFTWRYRTFTTNDPSGSIPSFKQQCKTFDYSGVTQYYSKADVTENGLAISVDSGNDVAILVALDDTNRQIVAYAVVVITSGSGGNQVTYINVIVDENDLPTYTAGDKLSEGEILLKTSTNLGEGVNAALAAGIMAVKVTEGNVTEVLDPRFLAMIDPDNNKSYEEILAATREFAEEQGVIIDPTWANMDFFNYDYVLDEDDTLGIMFLVGVNRGYELAQDCTFALNGEQVGNVNNNAQLGGITFYRELGNPQPGEGGGNGGSGGNQVTYINVIVDENDLPTYTAGDKLSEDGIQFKTSTNLGEGVNAALAAGIMAVKVTEGNVTEVLDPRFLAMIDPDNNKSYEEILAATREFAEGKGVIIDPTWANMDFFNYDYVLDEDDTLGIMFLVGVNRGYELAQDCTFALNGEQVGNVNNNAQLGGITFYRELGNPQPGEGGGNGGSGGNQVTYINVIVDENDLPTYTAGDKLSEDGIQFKTSTNLGEGVNAALAAGIMAVKVTEGNVTEVLDPGFLAMIDPDNNKSYEEILAATREFAEGKGVIIDPTWANMDFFNYDYVLDEDDTLGIMFLVGANRGYELAQDCTFALNGEQVGDVNNNAQLGGITFYRELGNPQPGEGDEDVADIVIDVDTTKLPKLWPDFPDNFLDDILSAFSMNSEKYEILGKNGENYVRPVITTVADKSYSYSGTYLTEGAEYGILLAIKNTADGTFTGDETVSDGFEVITVVQSGSTQYLKVWYPLGKCEKEVITNITIIADETKLPEIVPGETISSDGLSAAFTTEEGALYTISFMGIYEGNGRYENTPVAGDKEYTARFMVWATNGNKNKLADVADLTFNPSSKMAYVESGSDYIVVSYKLGNEPETPVKYTVSFDNNGGTGTMTAATVVENTEYTLPECGFAAPEGMEFKAWSVDGVEKDEGDTITVTKDLTITALWKDKAVEPEVPDTHSVTVIVKEEVKNPIDPNDPYVVRDDAIVTLVSLTGEKQVKEQSSGNGVYAFENVPNGIYNLVIEQEEDGKIKTVLVTVDGKSVDLGVIILPIMKINSEVVVEVDVSEDSPIKGALVGGLENLANNIAGGVTKDDDEDVTVDVNMTIDTQMSDKVDQVQEADIRDAAKGQSENLTFLDIKIDLTIIKKKNNQETGRETDKIHNTSDLLEIVIPFDTTGKTDFAVYRHHTKTTDQDTAEDYPFTERVQKLTKDANSYGERIVVDKDNRTITMYVQYFSTYAIGYSETLSDDDDENDGEVDVPAVDEDEEEDETPEAPQIPETPVIPSIPNIPTNPNYLVSVSGSLMGGKVELSSKSATQGKTVTITVTPDKGYELETLSVTDNKGNAVALTNIGGGKYTFVMPKSQVSISATFVKKDTSCTRGADCPIWPFTDAKTTEWYHDGVHYCIEKGLMNGLPGNLFAPNGTTTRAQIVTILWRLEGEPYANYAMSFTDVAAGKWYTEAVRWAAANGIVDGYSATAFGPNDSITREQMAAILWRYCQYKGIDVSVGEETNILSYSDAFDIHSWAMPAMQWACGAGVIGGITDGNSMKLDPTGTATRAQVATMLQRFCVEVMNP